MERLDDLPRAVVEVVGESTLSEEVSPRLQLWLLCDYYNEVASQSKDVRLIVATEESIIATKAKVALIDAKQFGVRSEVCWSD